MVVVKPVEKLEHEEMTALKVVEMEMTAVLLQFSLKALEFLPTLVAMEAEAVAVAHLILLF